MSAGFFAMFSKLPPNGGSAPFGPQHWAALGCCALLGLCLVLVYRRRSPRGRRSMRLAVAFTDLGSELLRDLIFAHFGEFNIGYLPLHWCGLALFFLVWDALAESPLTHNLLYGLVLPGALSALLFPDWLRYPPISLGNIHSFFSHCLLVSYVLMRLCGRDFVPDWRQLPRCFGFMVLCALPVYGFDRIFRTNYMFLLIPSPGSPLEAFARVLGNPGYILGMVAALFGVWLVEYLPIALACRRRGARRA